ncbi:hypothetical protein EJB05_46874, partial [Eragrostis curvula]
MSCRTRRRNSHLGWRLRPRFTTRSSSSPGRHPQEPERSPLHTEGHGAPPGHRRLAFPPGHRRRWRTLSCSDRGKMIEKTKVQNRGPLQYGGWQ